MDMKRRVIIIVTSPAALSRRRICRRSSSDGIELVTQSRQLGLEIVLVNAKTDLPFLFGFVALSSKEIDTADLHVAFSVDAVRPANGKTGQAMVNVERFRPAFRLNIPAAIAINLLQVDH